MAKTSKKIECAICGKTMELKPHQGAKKICAKCADDIKKIRMQEKYHKEKSPGSKRHRYLVGRLNVINSQLKEK